MDGAPTVWNLCVCLALQAPVTANPAAEQAGRTISLAGQWNFRLDPEGQGINQEWFGAALPKTIKLPGSTHENGYDTKTTGREAFWPKGRSRRAPASRKSS